MDVKAVRLRNALDVLYYSGAYKAMMPLARGCGAIFMLHRVLPGAKGADPHAFDPNGNLAIDPEFLNAAIGRVKAAGFELVDLDEAERRLRSGDETRFACFTLDDGYRDNRDHALPVFEDYECPFTVYINSGFADRKTGPWWVMLERLIAGREEITVEMGGDTTSYDCASPRKKYRANKAIAEKLLIAPGPDYNAAICRLADRYGFDLPGLAQELTMDWEELAQFAAHPLVTLGAHTANHPVLANLGDEEAAAEMNESVVAMLAHLGQRPRHFAYPYGHDWAASTREFDLAHDCGFATAVTTRKGVLFPEHGDHLMALPRVSLNGEYQVERYVDVLLSGAAFALLNRFRKVNAV